MNEKLTDAEKNTFQLISEFLNKVIDTQRASTEAVTQLTSILSEASETIEEVRGFFRNGFRSEIKDHVTRTSEQCLERFGELLDKHNERAELIERNVLETLKFRHELIEKRNTLLLDLITKTDKLQSRLAKPWYWIKIIGAILGAIAIIVAGLLELTQHL
jgi:ABC-type transporter Mla subunit MlaD